MRRYTEALEQIEAQLEEEQRSGGRHALFRTLSRTFSGQKSGTKLIEAMSEARENDEAGQVYKYKDPSRCVWIR